jgi:hypothetical protein
VTISPPFATGTLPFKFALDAATGTAYVPNQFDNDVSLFRLKGS